MWGLLEVYHETGIALGEVDGGGIEVWAFEGGVGYNTCCESHRALYKYLAIMIPKLQRATIEHTAT